MADASEAKPQASLPASLSVKEQDDSAFVTEPLTAMNKLIHRGLALWFTAIGVLTVVMLIRYWPVNEASRRVEDKIDTLTKRVEEIAGGRVDTLQQLVQPVAVNQDSLQKIEEMKEARSERRFFLIALLGGMLGGAAHGLSSLMTFRGNRRLFRSWSLWYICMPIVGGMMSIIFFVVLQAGLISNSGMSGAVNPYGVAALSALVGLFTDDATQKLSEVFKTLFATNDTREGKLAAKSEAKTVEKEGKK